MKHKSKLIWGFFLLLWMYLIFFMSAEPDTVSAEMSGGFSSFIQRVFFPSWGTLPESDYTWQIFKLEYLIRKAGHFAEFLILGGLWYGFLSSFKLNRYLVPFLSFLTGVLCASFDEFHQTLVDGRAGQVFDILIDSAGVFCGIFVFAGFIAVFFSPMYKKHSGTGS